MLYKDTYYNRKLIILLTLAFYYQEFLEKYLFQFNASVKLKEIFF